jgi:hypothetical protein
VHLISLTLPPPGWFCIFSAAPVTQNALDTLKRLDKVSMTDVQMKTFERSLQFKIRHNAENTNGG